ncbi:hypothetical protein B0H19DRAFT_1088366 [Mycena capillaripes]|nr:hypothetical protein B0H19DRAFT_1088366 [Mycena capillaripes]
MFFWRVGSLPGSTFDIVLGLLACASYFLASGILSPLLLILGHHSCHLVPVLCLCFFNVCTLLI